MSWETITARSVFAQHLSVERASAFGHDMVLISIIPAVLIGFLITILLSTNVLKTHTGSARARVIHSLRQSCE